MRLLLLFALLGLIVLITATPTNGEDNEEPNMLFDDADVGDLHSNDADRQARHWGGGWGGGWGGPRWGGGWGGSRWSGGWGGWGGRRWGGGGWGGWGGGFWG